MRQAKREITDINDLLDLLEKCQVTRLALSDNGQPYIVPMNYGYDCSDGQLRLYFHCAREGRKLDIIARNSRACFEIDAEHDLISGKQACQYSMNYASVIGCGTISIMSDERERLDGLNILMRHYSSRGSWSFDDKALGLTLVLRLDVESFAGKRLFRPGHQS